MIKHLIILFLFFSAFSIAQDSLTKILYPKLTIYNIYTKNEFTINWPLKNFEEVSAYSIYYQNNFITKDIFKKIIDVEPDNIKKQNLKTAYRNINYTKNLHNISLSAGIPFFIAGVAISFDGMLGHYGYNERILREGVAGSLLLAGIVCEIIAIVFNNKHKRSIKKAVLILND